MGSFEAIQLHQTKAEKTVKNSSWLKKKEIFHMDQKKKKTITTFHRLMIVVLRQISVWHEHFFILLLLHKQNKTKNQSEIHTLVWIHHSTNYQSPKNWNTKTENCDEKFTISDQKHEEEKNWNENPESEVGKKIVREC